jgi:hypothetical protein
VLVTVPLSVTTTVYVVELLAVIVADELFPVIVNFPSYGQ